ncbi:MAG TPA: hypothetical protein VN455_00980 [Methanotrichaceae archaeon]|nr:hypothetical protein [Methanotrichaceae archaeon]
MTYTSQQIRTNPLDPGSYFIINSNFCHNPPGDGGGQFCEGGGSGSGAGGSFTPLKKEGYASAGTFPAHKIGGMPTGGEVPVDKLPRYSNAFDAEQNKSLYTIAKNLDNGKLSDSDIKTLSQGLSDQATDLQQQIYGKGNEKLSAEERSAISAKYKDVRGKQAVLKTAVAERDKINLHRESKEYQISNGLKYDTVLPVQEAYNLEVQGTAGKSRMQTVIDDDGERVREPVNYKEGEKYLMSAYKVDGGYIATLPNADRYWTKHEDLSEAKTVRFDSETFGKTLEKSIRRAGFSSKDAFKGIHSSDIKKVKTYKP